MLTELARDELRRIAPGRPSAVTIGVFDGVHLGHQALIARLREGAAARGLASVVVTFHPAPVSVLRPDIRLSYITTLDERLQLLRGLGVSAVGPVTFTSELAQVSAHDFAAGLREHLDMRLILGGPDLSIGRRREGDVAWLQAHGSELGFAVETVEFVADGAYKMGSSAIRTALGQGDVETAARVLGRPFALHGPVVEGARRGRTIGFPTANIAVAADLAIPAFGVYVSRATVDGRGFMAATNIGRRPTFDDGPPSVEPHLLDFEGDLYGRDLRLELLARLRGEQRFAGIDALIAQIRVDVQATRDWFAAHPR